jgi:hypothetical protein
MPEYFRIKLQGVICLSVASLFSAPPLPPPTSCHAQQDQDIEEELSALLSEAQILIHARDSNLSSAFMEYSVTVDYPEANKWHYKESGWIGWCGETWGIRADIDTNLGKSEVRRADWDGKVFREVAAEDAILPTVTFRSAPSLPFSAYDPLNFGLRFNGTLISDVLTNSRAIPLGRETVNGRDCLAVAIAPLPQNGTEAPEPLGVIWIDDRESLLAIRSCMLAGPEAVGSLGPETVIHGSRYEILRQWDVLEYCRQDELFYFPTACRFWSRLDNHVVRTVINRGSLLHNEDAVICSRLRIAVEDSYFFVHDLRLTAEKRNYISSPDGELSPAMAAFYGELVTEALRHGKRKPTLLEPSILFDQLSCGTAALLFASYLCEIPATYELLRTELPDRDTLPENNLQQLRVAATKIGLYAKAVKINDVRYLEDLISQGQIMALVHIKDHEDVSQPHFAIPVFHEEGVDLISPPSRDKLSLRDFQRLWTGYALLVSGQPFEDTVAGVVSAQQPFDPRVAILVAVPLIGGLFLGLWQVKRVGRRVRAGANSQKNRTHHRVILFLIGCHSSLLGACGQKLTHESVQREPLVILADFPPPHLGTLRLGSKIQTSLSVLNVTDDTVQVEALGACSCDRVEIDPKRLPPGELARVDVLATPIVTGPWQADLMIRATRHGETQIVQYRLSATIEDAPPEWTEVVPGRLDFGRVSAGKPSMASLAVYVQTTRTGISPEITKLIVDPSVYEWTEVAQSYDGLQLMHDRNAPLHKWTMQLKWRPEQAMGKFNKVIKVNFGPPLEHLQDWCYVAANVVGALNLDPPVLYLGSIAPSASFAGTATVMSGGTRIDPANILISSGYRELEWAWHGEEPSQSCRKLLVRGIAPSSSGLFNEELVLRTRDGESAILQLVGRIVQ